MWAILARLRVGVAEFTRVTLVVDPQAARQRRGLAPLTSLRVLWEGVRRAPRLGAFNASEAPKTLVAGEGFARHPIATGVWDRRVVRVQKVVGGRSIAGVLMAPLRGCRSPTHTMRTCRVLLQRSVGGECLETA
jgi:hypothetical protein